MPMLYTSPHFVALDSAGKPVGSATLTFSATGTSTLQNTYQDVGLTLAHLNPVTADADGVFPLIYLDPSLPNYRITLKDASGVQLDQQDDIPSNENTAQTIRLKSTAPELIFQETDALAGYGKWAIKANNNQLQIVMLNDAESVETVLATITRIGSTPQTFDFAGNTLTVGTEPVATIKSSQFTATLLGVSGTVTGTINYYLISDGLIVVLFCNSGIFGTSNATSFQLSGVPGLLRARFAFKSVHCFFTDNGVIKGGTATIDTSGGITFGTGIDGNTAGFTNSGTKGIPIGWTLVFVP